MKLGSGNLLHALVFLVFAVVVASLSHAAEFTADQVRELLAKADRDKPADLTGRDLSDLDLSNIDFKRANLSGANLFAARLVSSNLAGAKLARANLNGAWLMGTNFAGADLSDSSMLSLVILGGQVKEKPNFAGANLSGVRMIADLPGTDLHGANLSRAKLGVDIKNQGMGQMRTDLSGANLAGADLHDADLSRSLMMFADLKGANLRGANFFRVKLAGADLSGADVAGADFTEADLEGTVLTGVKGLGAATGMDWATNRDQAGHAQAHGAELKTIAILDFDLVDDQHELSPATVEYQRLRAIRDQLQEEFVRHHLYRVVDLAPASGLMQKYQSATQLHACNGCELEIARSLHADRVLIGWVQKVSNLILNINIQIEDVATGAVLLSKSVDLRGNTDETWRRGASYLVRSMVEKGQGNR